MLDENGIATNPAALASGALPPKLSDLEAWGAYKAAMTLGQPPSTAKDLGGGLAAGLYRGGRGSTLKDSLVLSGATGFVLVGDPLDDGCALNKVAGAVSIQNNMAGVNLGGNRLSTNVKFNANHGGGLFAVDAAPVVSGNVIGGSLSFPVEPQLLRHTWDMEEAAAAE